MKYVRYLLLGILIFTTPFAKAEANTWEQLIQKAQDAVVQVYSFNAHKNIFRPDMAPEQSVNSGTAFFIKQNEKLYLFTNFHVVGDAIAVCIEVPSLGKQRFEVEILRCRPNRDAALLRLKPEVEQEIREKLGGTIPFLELGDSDKVVKGQKVMAFGFPLGTRDGIKTTRGNLSGKQRIEGFHYLQMTAPISFGNSGGPTLDKEGKVVGINTRGNFFAENSNYMIPVNDIKPMFEMRGDMHNLLIERRPSWGIIVCPSTKSMREYLGNVQDHGVYVVDVIEGALFERSGIQKGDVLHAINSFAIDPHGYVFVPWCQGILY